MHELAFCKDAHILTRIQPFAVHNMRHNTKQKSFLTQGIKQKVKVLDTANAMPL